MSKLIKYFFSLIIIISSYSFAQTCSYIADKDSLEVNFIGYKTSEKVGVGGYFNVVDAVLPNEPMPLRAALNATSLTIATLSIETGLLERNANIWSSLFLNMLQPEAITAKVISISENALSNQEGGTITVAVTMNGTTVDIPMEYQYADGVLSAEGVIDLIEDFKAVKGFEAFAEKCADLHLNKTWKEVAIGFKVSVSQDCSL